ncbi:hypothetical protein, partial [Actinoplanes sp. ATCC 53533]|uniref:hypothetical protein n=1 Tax=Actinoplanes sp. ATCC 53533 TaxID=1288362 RepID=UPI001F23F939
METGGLQDTCGFLASNHVEYIGVGDCVGQVETDGPLDGTTNRSSHAAIKPGHDRRQPLHLRVPDGDEG